VIAALLKVQSGSSATAGLSLGPAKFEVLNADGTEVIGHSQYDLRLTAQGLLVGRGEAHFSDGEFDIERDTLRPRPGKAPLMLTLGHRLYNGDGSLQRAATADFGTGQAACVRYQRGVATTDHAIIKATPDSYGGSAVVLPLQQNPAQGARAPLKLHAFNCIPGPRLVAVKTHLNPPSQWSHYSGQTVEVDIEPDLGWLNAVLAPLLPKLRAWFDPSRDWQLVGAQFARYFRGPQIILVRCAGSGSCSENRGTGVPAAFLYAGCPPAGKMAVNQPNLKRFQASLLPLPPLRLIMAGLQDSNVD